MMRCHKCLQNCQTSNIRKVETMEKNKITFLLNGDEVTLEVNPKKRLLDMLREDFKLFGVKEGCSEGECGACTVIFNGEAITSCLVLAPQVNGSQVTTIEGLISETCEMHPIQQAFIDAGAVQCGFCTPAMILSAKALIDKKPDPSEEDIKTAISGNLCRCTGYTKIIEAVQLAAKRMRGESAHA